MHQQQIQYFLLLTLIPVMTEVLLFHQDAYVINFNYAKITYINKQIAYGERLVCNRYNRTHKALNFDLCITEDINRENLKLNNKVYKLVNNINSFLLLQFDVIACDALEKNVFGARKLVENGNLTLCPIKKGCYQTRNYLYDSSAFPPNIPAGEYNYQINFMLYAVKALTLDFFVEIVYKI